MLRSKAMAEIQLREIDEVTILDVKGPLKIGEGDNLLINTFQRLQELSRSLIIINLSDVPYIEDGPLGALLGCCAQVIKNGGYVKVINAQTRVAKFMEITKISGFLFQFCESEEAAISSLREQERSN